MSQQPWTAGVWSTGGRRQGDGLKSVPMAPVPPCLGGRREVAPARLLYLEKIGGVEADLDGRHHPRVEQHLQDVSGHGVSHQVQVQRVLP